MEPAPKIISPPRHLPSTAYFQVIITVNKFFLRCCTITILQDGKRIIDYVLVYEDDDKSEPTAHRQQFELLLKRLESVRRILHYNPYTFIV